MDRGIDVCDPLMRYGFLFNLKQNTVCVYLSSENLTMLRPCKKHFQPT